MPDSAGSSGARLRAAYGAGCIAMPGVFNALAALTAERHGFPAIYLSGAALTAGHGVPDIGLLSTSEFVDAARYITAATNLPLLVDADTGFGGTMNVERAVVQFEQAGVAGIQIEDQQLPKRCGHLSGKSLVTTEEMEQKIRAAAAARSDPGFVIVARTDAVGVNGFDAAVERSNRYLEAGADVIFGEALESREEFSRFRSEVDAPLLANMTEFGRSPLLSRQELEDIGYAIALYPVTGLRVAMKAVDEAYAELAASGTQADFVGRMQTRAELYDLIGYDGYEARDREYFGEA
ncbi:MAG: methylisocitrate lyase [Chloroflexi bacterium]|nr:methylisocitrate lyase [Chloroflexota bacterium]